MLICNEGETPAWYPAIGLLGQGRGVQVFAVEVDEVISLMGTAGPHSLDMAGPRFWWGWPSVFDRTAVIANFFCYDIYASLGTFL